MMASIQGMAPQQPLSGVAQSVAAHPAGHSGVPVLGTGSEAFSAVRDRPEPVGSAVAPHFLGALLIATPVGFISCIAALLFGWSVLESLAVYTLAGTVTFVGLVTIRSGPDHPEP
jgi:hypothetical protein